MKFHQFLSIGALSLSLVAGGAFAADKAAKQAEVNKSAQAALAKFYTAKPELKSVVAKAPGYGVFTTYGLSFVIGGEGGKGVVHNNKTKTNTYMNMGGASVGGQIGIAESDVLIVFKTAAALNSFVTKGWSATGGANVSAGAGGKSAGGGQGENTMKSASTYTLTKNGVTAGVAIGGAKFWKDDDMN